MHFYPFEVSIPHITYACLGGFVVLFGMFSLFLREKLYVGEACWAFVFGVIIGPYGAGIFDPRGWGKNEETTNMITLEFTRVVLAIGVFGIGVELPKAYMKRHWKSLFYLLGPVMTWGWFVSAGFIYALVPGLNFLSSLAVAACLTPTDPILAQAVVGGKYADKHVPAHIRHLLAAESGCNDGAAFPFLYIALYLIIDQNTGHAIRDWFLLLWLYQVTLGIVIGAAVGFGFRYLMKYCEKWDLIDRHSYVAQYVSLALFTVGVTVLLGSDDLLSTFACGTAFAWDGFFNRQTEESVFSSVMDLLFNVACFIFIGAWMPFSSFQDAELTLSVWRLIVIAILVLLFRRLPVVIAFYKWIPDIKTFREAIFSGHFGPIGVGAVFISTLAAEVLHTDAPRGNHQTEMLEKTIQPIVAFMVLCSILIHGLSIPSFSLGRRVHSVTRTWSRHTTMGGTQETPEWANQTTVVTNRDEIVVNRDDHLPRDMVDGMERGELTAEEKKSTGSGSLTEKDSNVETLERNTENRHHHPPEKGETLPEGEIPPDGDEIVSEWQEGPHRVIERRKGPGEEVEVEVIKNYGSPDAHTSRFRGTHHSAHEHLNAYLKKLRHLVEVEEKTATEKVQGIEKELAHLEQKAKETVHSLTSQTSSPSNKTGESSSAQIVLNDNAGATPDGDDDEWADDDEEPSASSSAAGLARIRSGSESGGRSKSPKIKPTGSGGASKKPKGAGRRRPSIRKGLSGVLGMSTAKQQHQRSPDREQGDDDVRGRSEAPVARNPRHLRIQADSLRTRESSPARSVRWMDESSPGSGRNSGALTPRYSSVFQHGSPVSLGQAGNSRPPSPPPGDKP